MLWQPSLPEVYHRLLPHELGPRIEARRRELGEALVILGHHYQTDEVIRHADITGDSLKLSQAAAGLAMERSGERPVRWVVFCGVHFMAETADMLTPDGVSVILPDLSAGCSMADMAAYDDTVQAWEEIHGSLRSSGWDGTVVPVTYVNSSAAIKAFVGERGGACCTSSNAASVFRWAMAGGECPGHGKGGRVKVLFLPDQHLGRNTAAACGIDVERRSCLYDPRRSKRGEELGGATPRQVLESDVILWAGHCSVHKLFRPEHGDQVRSSDRAEHDEAVERGMAPPRAHRILVHPECCREVVEKADLAGSTEFIIRAIQESEPGSRWAVGTEFHLVNRLAREAAGRGVHVRILSECRCLCTTMYRIDEPHLLWVLDGLAGAFSPDGSPRVLNRIQVHPEVRRLAVLAIDRMLRLAQGEIRSPGREPVSVD
ncbi:MAG TPA: quinolinate synthase NadA [Phycisphaerales bacterium]|nr:quinolinate synthase NadA [Phycisphaerae bacterium]HRJ49816.1 quinolinate synthase NadA [Phycisphaerales bacterium]